MADIPNTVAQPSIAALPPPTIRQLGSGQVLIDHSSVVKELIDNALDARAKSIFIDISANTLDSIQVKDDGHGIPSDDQSLVCRRYCTSKIRDLNDLRELGGKWLGFRGEALASMAEMSSAFSVTTRVEGDPVAVKLKYSRDGELESVAHDSHPVGTTVKVMGFLEHIPVRKQMAIKDAAKCLGKIRRVMQAYALARPSARFRLRVLKAKNRNGDFSYAPKAHATVGDAVLKIFGRDCAAQCSFTTVEADGFEIRAFLPKPTAVGSKISGHCSFVAVDARPVSSNRGTIKQMVHACKQRLGKANPSLAGPTKDDVMFEDSNIVLRVWEELLDSLYTEAVVNLDEPDDVVDQNPNEAIFESHNTSDQNEASVPAPQPRWRHSMYGIDEEDLEFLQDDRTPIIDEEEGRHAAEVSNPWTITRMNAAIKPRAPANNVQLLSPVKSTGNVDSSSSPSRVPATPNRVVSAEPLTPQTSSKANTVQSLLDDELERSIQRLPPPSLVAESISDWVLDRLGGQAIDGTGTHVAGGEVPSSVLRSETQAPEPRTSQLSQYRNIATGTVSPGEGPLNQNQPAVRRTTRQKKTKDATTAYRPPGNSQKRLAGVSEMAGGRIVEWVGRIDGKLCGMYERARGADEIRVVMEEGMRKALEGIEWEDEEEQGDEEMLMDT
ncbi:hypothetical protein COCVIDRAFT_114307 [Bipolaris victoriae FI3]|uniref:DNA mismatch repair protein S5 domain-containing protein n=1 Tax=Bipolaris victoriae (strain FI3) TaxID=930091 RepID=W7E5M3_BIPV3|nr:hypothetical protein COCVIDRAFT_114307 [Bipolaris victoriae FI3]